MKAIISHVRKAGRCWNGFHKDGGVVIHAVIGEEVNGFWGTKAFCGTSPGLRGYGWSKSDKEISCEKCLKKMNKENQSTSE